MNTKQRIIAVLLKNKRPDLANALAGTVKARPRVAPKRRPVRAGTWQEKAKAELEAELGGIETEETRYGPNDMDAFSLQTTSGRADNGESEWIVFKNMKAAERYAVEYVKEQLEDDPSMFTQDWLKKFVKVSPTDIRLIASEEANNYLEGIEDEDDRVLQEAGLSRQYDGLQDKIDSLEDKMTEELDPKKSDRMQNQVDKLRQAMDKLRDKATSKVYDDYESEITKQLKDDPMSWAEDLGYDFGSNRPNWLSIDTDKAAKDAVNTDGVAHFLDGYDGEEVKLDSGAVAFGTN